MSSDRWARLQELFHAASALPAERRAEFLDRACAGDQDLKRQAEALLASSDQTADLVEAAIGGAAEDVLTRGARSVLGERVGPYRVISELGHGGMGAVYLAARDDDQYQKQVAVKVVRAGLDSPDLLDRFRSERQILAQLEHPNIARMLDGGAGPGGVPYVVMEYIDGEQIADYCERRKLSVVERLKLFALVCAAVQYAHQRLVVHRDIKPTNILVTVDGTPKLLDFGIAKLLEPGATGQTHTEFRPFTPDYASPEQVRGEPVTTATDVYSLGVLLYELLTGQKPHRITSNRAADIERVISEQEPEKPGAVRKELRGDLENIILMAMRKEPSRRYGSAHELSEDIRRYLDGYPVRARRDTWAYRAGKFVRRNKLAVGAAATFALVLVGFSGTMAVLAQRLSRERDTAQQVSNFLVELFQVSDPSEARGNQVTAREILEKGADKITRELSDRPQVQARLMATMGHVFENLGLPGRAIPLLERSVEIRRRVLGAGHLEVAESLLALGEARTEAGKLADAEPAVRECLEIRRKRLGPAHADVGVALNYLAHIRHVRGNYAEAEALRREALSVLRKALGNEHPSTSNALHGLARVMLGTGNYAAAEPLFREALALDRKLLGADHPGVATTLNNLALLYRDKADYRSAEPLLREALAIYTKVYGEEHPYTAICMANVGAVREAQGDYESSEKLLRRSFEIQQKRNAEKHPYTLRAMGQLARGLHAGGKQQESEALFKKAVELWANSRSTAFSQAMTDYGLLLHDQGKQKAAQELFNRALTIIRERFPKGNPESAFLLIGLGSLLTRNGDLQSAEPLLREALDLTRSRMPKGHWRASEAESAWGAWLAAGRRYDEAEPMLIASYGRIKDGTTASSPESLRALDRIVTMYQNRGKPEKAAEYRALRPVRPAATAPRP